MDNFTIPHTVVYVVSSNILCILSIYYCVTAYIII